MPGPEIASYITGWQPSSVSPQAADFARAVVSGTVPDGRERAKNLLWAAGRLADWAIGLGLEPVPQVLLHPSVIERFTAHAPGLTGVTRRTLRTNLRFIARAVVPALHPADLPLPRERAKAPYAPAQISGYLALAGAQPTAARRMRAAGLVCLGAGARADPRRPARRARHRHQRPIRRRGSHRPRPQATRRAGAGPLPRAAAGISQIRRRAAGHRRDRSRPPERDHTADHLTGGRDRAARLDTSRLRATWLADCAELLGLATFLHAAGISCSQRLGDIVAALQPGRRGRGGGTARRDQPVSSPAALTRIEGIIDGSGTAQRIEALLPIGVRHRQLRVRTLLTGMMLTLDNRRPALLTEVHAALNALTAEDQVRLGVVEDWHNGPHQLTYRQVERTFSLVADTLSKDQPDGAPSDALARTSDDLLEASIPAGYKDASTALAVDWTDVETFSPRPPRHGTQECADPKRPGGTVIATCLAPRARCSSATTSQPLPWSARKQARPSPNWPAG